MHATAQVAGSGKPILIVHGFEASIGHFRRHIPELAQTHKVCKYGHACGASCCLHRSRAVYTHVRATQAADMLYYNQQSSLEFADVLPLPSACCLLR